MGRHGVPDGEPSPAPDEQPLAGRRRAPEPDEPPTTDGWPDDDELTTLLREAGFSRVREASTRRPLLARVLVSTR